MPSYFKSSRTKGPQAPVELPSPAQNSLYAHRAQMFCAFLMVLCFSAASYSQTAQPAPTQGPATSAPATAPAPDASKPSISLSPAVIMAKGNFGQGLTQTLTLSNQTGRDFAFEL